MVRRCPTLTLLRLPALTRLDQLVDELGQPELTLIIDTDAPVEMVSRLPGNFRVVRDEPGVWKKLAGW